MKTKTQEIKKDLLKSLKLPKEEEDLVEESDDNESLDSDQEVGLFYFLHFDELIFI